MWKTLSISEWEEITVKKNTTIFYKYDYLETISTTYNLKINLMGYKSKGDYLSFISFFSKGKDIIIPEGFSYSPFYIEKGIAEQIYFGICDSLIVNLKSDFKKICFKLEVDFFDLRPFIWNNFKIEVRYTHIKNNSLAPHYSINKNLSKIDLYEFEFVAEDTSEKSVDINLNFLKALGSSPSHIHHYKQLINGWSKSGYLKAFNLYKKGELIASNLVLFDYPKKKVYTILLNNAKTNEKFSHTLLYYNQINWCYENGFTEVDLCGANIRGISIFKSFFNTDLKMYFIISYRPFTGYLKSKWKVVFNKLYLAKGYILNKLP
ncbi:hypothetical protein BCY91_13240 [Pelobium manganitolerans]|uniref:BioF2-like acetyltransferase domain-containing protein n=1 Tax=Pelobium manganitolerans TaxID=1842495 RepID=A0A419SAV4_9SPHI|nr:hypothetical protein [Pelobium manganitolerans]RKD19560.1 hypothetical protein BCY91_13240 [Pelobium manganitolerans]